MSATPKTAYKSTTTPSSASRYVSPPPINTALYSLYTETFTVTVSADVQSTTFTTTYESTLTSTLIPAKDTSTSAAATNSASTSTSVPIAKGKVTLTTGVLVAIIVGPIVAIAIGLGLFFWLRKRSKRNGMKLLDQPSHPPPNGPIGADQVHSYEVDLNPASGTPQSPKKYTYVPPVNELSGEHGAQSLSQEKRWGQAVEMGGYEHSPAPPPTPRSPAPAYTTYNPAAIAVELDGTSSMRGRGGWS
jgi:hypothetical protein